MRCKSELLIILFRYIAKDLDASNAFYTAAAQ